MTNAGTAEASYISITDNMPKGFTFSGYKTSENADWTSLSGNFSSSNNSIAAGETVTVYLKGNVNSTDTPDSITNRVEVTSILSSTIDATAVSTRDTSGDYKAEKWIVDADGNKLAEDSNGYYPAVAEGSLITYRSKFTNVSGAAMTDLYMADTILGQFSTLESIKVIDASNEAYQGKEIPYSGEKYGYNNDYTKGWYINWDQANYEAGTTPYPYMIYCFKDINLAPGDFIEIEYTTRAANPSTASYPIVDGKATGFQNLIGFGTTEQNNAGVMTYKAGVASAFDYTFSTKKTVGQNQYNVSESKIDDDISDLTLEQLLEKQYYFKVETSAQNQDTSDYSNTTIQIIDELPDGMMFSEIVSGGDGVTVDTDSQPGKVIFTYANGVGTQFAGKSIVYTTRLTNEKAAALFQTAEKSTKLTNTVTKVEVKKGDNVVKTQEPNVSATVNFKKLTPAPGFAKLAYQSFPGTVYEEELLQPVKNGYITAGDTLIWRTVVYNGNGSADYSSDNTADLINYSVTDTLPSSYSYDAGTTGYNPSINIYTIGEDGLPGTVKRSVGWVSPTSEGKNYTWDFTGDTYKLAPNECLVIEFATVADVEKEGVITNTGYATIQQGFTVEDTVAGEKQDDTIHSYANYNIVGLTTESWKTITYTNQGHTGDPHTDPITDTGESRNPTHNYVQGMQGEKVTYTLHVKNNSPLDLENMTIIDRLPYVGDLGLVSGYARNSAFGVTMGEITSVTVNGTDVGYTKSYSTDKASVLDEFSKDWRGQNDVMSWNASAADAVNFRIQIDSNVVIEPADEVVVTFTATVPSYVANTGEENIAWNSFAYAYQNEILGDTVMVAEPAKVGVWVETPDTKIDININKTLTAAESKDATFYFALFADENYSTRLSDVISVTIPAGQTKASVTMKDVDLASIQTQLTTQANNIYLLETDAKGDKIAAYTSTYTNNKISLTADENVTVGVTNTKNTGSITVNKTLAGDKITGDTFYFALFTKDTNNNYIRYEDVPVQPLTFTEAGEQKLTFENVPCDVDFYVLETNANGVIADTDFENYTSDSGINYTSTAPAAVQAGETCAITNTELVTYSITVSKVLISDKIKTNPTFMVGLFDNAEGSGDPIETQKVTSGSEVTFDNNLEKDTTYYVFELDEDGKPVKAGEVLTKGEVYFDADTKETDVPFIVVYDGGGTTPIQFTETNSAGEVIESTNKNVIITNNQTDEEQNKIIVTKTVISDSSYENAEFTFGLFTMNADGEYVPVGDTKTIKMGESNTAICEFTDLTVGTPYYVFEMDGNTRCGDGTTIQVDGQTYVVSYPGGNQTLLEAGIPGAVQVVNTHANTPKLTFEKLDANGSPLEGAAFTLTPDEKTKDALSSLIAENSSIVWGEDRETYTLSGTSGADGIIEWEAQNAVGEKSKTLVLAKGKYTLTEDAGAGYAPVSITFKVDDGKFFDTTEGAVKSDTLNNYNVSATKFTVYNRSIVNVSKQDIADKGKGKELAGAKIQITANDASNVLIENLLSLTRGDTEFKKVEKFSETADYTEYMLDGSSLTFWSDGVNPTKITGLPNGSYTMTEIVAPDGYDITTELNFTIANGVVSADEENDSYLVTGADTDNDGNKIVMMDSEKKTITISKYAVNGTEELDGAILTLTALDETIDLTGVTGTYTDKSAVTFGEQKKTFITWTSDAEKGSINLTGLPAGKYTLTETQAPDGYTLTDAKTEELTFTVDENGKVTTVGAGLKLDETDETHVIMEDDKSVISISKKEITGETEIAGASLRLTYTGEETVDLTKVDVSIDGAEKTANTIQWTSGETEMVLTGLLDGTYQLEETGSTFEYHDVTYSVLNTTMTFTVENGVITNTTGTQDTHETADADTGYYYYNSTEDANAIEVCDAVTAEETFSVNISKQDIAGEEVEGAALRVYYTDEEGNIHEVNWITEADEDGNITPHVLNGLIPGIKYTLEETGAPDGYAYAEEITFSVDETGKVTVDANGTLSEDGKTVIMTDEALSVSISKKALTGGDDELAGAKLELYLLGTDANGNQTETLVDSWISGDKPHVISIDSDTTGETKLIAGKTYLLRETGAPDGYQYADDMTFTIEKDGTITGSTTMYDAALGELGISKKDIYGDEVIGAHLQILDENEEVIEKWISEKEPHVVSLDAGSYTLIETIAPDGYQIATAISFTVDAEGKATIDGVDQNGLITMTDDVAKVSISKVGEKGDTVAELPGASMKLTYTGDGTLDNVTAKNGTIAKEGKVITWTSGAEALILEKIPDGAYTLEETLAPNDSYELATKITFEVEDGVVKNVIIDKDSKSEYTDGVIRMFDALKLVTTETTEVTDTSTNTETNTETTTVSSEASSASDTEQTESATTASTIVTTVSGTVTSAGPTNTTTNTTTTTNAETTVTAASTASSSSAASTEGSTNTTSTATSAGPTNTTTGSTTTTMTTTTESTAVSETESSGTTASASASETTAVSTETSTAATTSTTITDKTTVSSAATTSSTATASSAATTTSAGTTSETDTTTNTTVSTQTTSESTADTTVTTTVTGVVIRKCDMVGNEIAGASLTVADLSGDLIDAWISEEGISHVIANAQVGVPYCLTETLAPTDFAIAAPIYFQLEADGTVSILTYQLNEDGSLALDESGAPVLLSIAQGTDNVVIMVDEYTGPGTLTTSAATTTTTTTTTTTATTTTPRNSTEGNGEHTPTATQPVSSESTQEGTDSDTNTAVSGTNGTQTTTTSKKTSTGSSSKSISSSPKTDDMFPAILIPTGVALAAALMMASKRKKK